MASTYYSTVNGRLTSQVRYGSRRDYLTDALGSVTATSGSAGTVENTYRYKPYGSRLAKTGAAADPRFQWTGNTGSSTTGLRYSEQYNRARHYGAVQAAWTSVDPVWPTEAAYGYVSSNPTSKIDPSGYAPTPINKCPKSITDSIAKACAAFKTIRTGKRRRNSQNA